MKKIAIIISTEDPASVNIGKHLENHTLPKNVTIHTIDTRPIYADAVFDTIDCDLFIFATKHSSAKGVPSLTVHPTGNWFANDLGGEKREISIAPALYLAEGLLQLDKLNEENKLEMEVVQEVTHHGPTVARPLMFIEIGSSLNEWQNEQYGAVLAEAIVSLVSSNPPKKKVAFGIGGTHYTPNFKKLIVREDYAFGHICPKYQLEYLSFAMVEQALEKTTPKVEEVVFDWKGCSGHREKVKDTMAKLREKGVNVRKI
jgi:D-aminoacyl-tRNA deacylase